MIPLWFLEVTKTENAPVKCELTDQTSGHDSLSVAVDITDKQLTGILQQADPALRELLDLVATRAYKFGYSEGSLDAGVSEGVLSTSELFGKSAPLMSFRELYQRLVGEHGEDEKDSDVTSAEARQAEFQAIEDEILKHEPGSGVGSLTEVGYIGRPNPVDR